MLTSDQLDEIFPDRRALIAASGIERSEDEAFIPWACILNASAQALDAVIPGWRVIETVQAVPSALLETDEARAS